MWWFMHLVKTELGQGPTAWLQKYLYQSRNAAASDKSLVIEMYLLCVNEQTNNEG